VRNDNNVSERLAESEAQGIGWAIKEARKLGYRK